MHGPLHFPTVVAQHLRSRPQISHASAQIVRDFLIEESRGRTWDSICLNCNPLNNTLEWLASVIAANNSIVGRRALKRLRR